MQTLSQVRLKRILTTGLKLKEPVFRLERVGSRLVGDVISSTFVGKRDRTRQEMIWEALNADLGEHAPRQVGMLLAYTPAEWNIDTIDFQPMSRRGSRAAKRAG